MNGHSSGVTKLLLVSSYAICSASADSTIIVWNISLREPIHTLEGHEGYVHDIIVLTNNTLASVGEDKMIRLWKS